MTLKQVIRVLEAVASWQPSVNMIVRNDVFRLNTIANAKYGVFAWLQGQHSTSADSSFIDFQFTLFYVDRLLDDRRNEVEIHSTGVQTLNNIIRALDDYDIVSETEYTFQTFNQRFADLCAGVYCRVTLTVPVTGICPEFFADFNNDFNDDFNADGIEIPNDFLIV